jgi:hypothetical protein
VSQVVLALVLALAVSLAGNAWQIHTYLGVRDDRTAAIGERDQARSAATMCSDATEALHEAAGKRAIENKAAVATAAAKAEARGRKAAQELMAGPTRPGDDCGSAGDRVNRWLEMRGQP